MVRRPLAITPFGMTEVFWASLKSFQEPVMVGKLLSVMLAMVEGCRRHERRGGQTPSSRAPAAWVRGSSPSAGPDAVLRSCRAVRSCPSPDSPTGWGRRRRRGKHADQIGVLGTDAARNLARPAAAVVQGTGDLVAD